MDKSGEDAKTLAAKDAQAIVEAASFAAIGTTDVVTRAAYVSLVAVAGADGAPVMLLSRLARHTRNLLTEPEASILFTPAFDPTVGHHPDPLTQARVTLTGRIVASTDERDRSAFLARHHSASSYAGFSDFGFYRLEVKAAHFIGGFGRIVELSAEDLCGARKHRS